MRFFSVSVDFTLSSSKLSASGVKICNHFVLTHGSLIFNLFTKFMKEYPKYRTKFNFFDKQLLIDFENDFRNFINLSNSKFTVVLPTENFDSDIKNYNFSKFVFNKIKINANDKCVQNSDQSGDPIIYTEAYLEHVFAPPDLLSEFSELFSENSWKFDKDGETHSTNNSPYEDIYLSSFLLLRIKKESNLKCCLKEFETFTTYPEKGATLFIDGCPFGGGMSRPVFLNSLSKGIISNISHHGNIFLTDARCIFGCEGAPGYSLNEKYGICGIVISPFCWFRGEWVGLTFMASLKPLLKYMKESLLISTNSSKLCPKVNILEQQIQEVGDDMSVTFENLSLRPKNLIINDKLTDIIDDVQKAIVRVLCSNSVDWGTGFLVESGKELMVITCAHVIEGIKNNVEIIHFNGNRETGFVIYCSNRHDVWDIAIIRLNKKSIYNLSLTKDIPPLGTELFIGGHPIFKGTELCTPTFTYGILSKVCSVLRSSFSYKEKLIAHSNSNSQINTIKNVDARESSFYKDFINFKENCGNFSQVSIPVIMQTTCAVYNGVSGGPVIAIHPSKGPVVVAIVSCCARDQQNEVSFPHVNMTTPVYMLAEALDNFHLFGNILLYNQKLKYIYLQIRNSNNKRN